MPRWLYRWPTGDMCVLETGYITLKGTSEELRESEDVKKAYLGV